jgi:hypothetical protein
LLLRFVVVVGGGGAGGDDGKNLGKKEKFTSIEMILLSDTYPPCDILNVLFFKRKACDSLLFYTTLHHKYTSGEKYSQ